MLQNERVVRQFLRYDPYSASAGSLYYLSGARELHSYGQRIGLSLRNEKGRQFFIGDFTAKGKRFVSTTTSRHVNLVKKHALDMGVPITVMEPSRFDMMAGWKDDTFDVVKKFVDKRS